MPHSVKTLAGRIFLISVSWPICFVLVASAQQSTYSADSLMAAFEKGSKNSLKGSEITFTDIIVESKKSRVVFKSSGNDKVICELVSPINDGNTLAFVGSPLTVVGRVRGRGMLGNVTLDECKLALSDATTNSPAATPVEQPTAAPSDEVSKERTELSETTPTTGSGSRLPSTARIPPPVPPDTGRTKAPGVQADTGRTEAPGVQADRSSSETVNHPNEVSKEASNSKARLAYALYTFVAVAVALAILALVKLFLASNAHDRGSSSTASPTPDMRRVALEQLLSGQKKKKWRTHRTSR